MSAIDYRTALPETRKQINQASSLIETAALFAIQRLGEKIKNAPAPQQYAYRSMQNFFKFELEGAIKKQCEAVMSAASLPPSKFYCREDAKKKRDEDRKALAIELRRARNKFQEIKRRARNLEQEIEARVSKEVVLRATAKRAEYRERLLTARTRLKKIEESQLKASIAWALSNGNPEHSYPNVPLPIFEPTKYGEGLPTVSGVYFLWEGDRVVYVGQAVNLSSRVRLVGHHVLRAEHKISFVFCDVSSLDFAECFYIGITRPRLNFGTNARWRR